MAANTPHIVIDPRTRASASCRMVRAACAAVCGALLLAGCIKPVLPPQVAVQLGRTQTESVRGKTIVIDPGHGGPERGAIGENGLHEAEVNLGVALYLWGFLKEAGADPVLTRSIDASVFQGDPFDLKSDLHARAALSNARAADLFVSVHHNADERNSSRDDLIVFYKMADPGQSRDAARELCAALQDRLNPSRATIQPGNFHVLRATQAPAVLGEASFLTNKKTATMLSYHRALAAEAAGYFQGICSYFQKGIPRVTDCHPDNATITEAQPGISCRVGAGTDNATLDSASLTVRLDGERLSSCSLQGDQVTCTPGRPLANGRHRYCITVRNSNGNISPEFRATFTVALPAHRITVTPLFQTVPAAADAGTPVRICAEDNLQRPVADGTVIELSTDAGRLDETRTATVGGCAGALLYADPEKRQARIRARCGKAEAQAQVAFGTVPRALFLARVRDPDGRPLPGATLSRGGFSIGLSDAFGWVHDEADTCAEVSYSVAKKGYRPATLAVTLESGRLIERTITLAPVDEGIFFDRVIMLDAVGTAPQQTPVCAALAGLIECAGGSVKYGWDAGGEPSDARRVQRADRESASLFMRFESSKKPVVRYYYKSSRGELAASLIAQHLNGTVGGGRRVWNPAAGTDYILAHTAMPAVIASVPPARAAAQYEKLAEAVYAALRDFFAQERGIGQPASADSMAP